MRPAVFLDRDGVIVKQPGFLEREKDYITSPEQVELIGMSGEAVRLLNESHLVFIVTNQAQVAYGFCGEGDFCDINTRLLGLLSIHGARIDKIYACFHHPIKGVGRYRVECDCRKPKPGMIFKAAKEFDIDLGKSFLVGDKISDIMAGYNAGMRTILVKTGYGGRENGDARELEPDFEVDDLYAAAKLILKL